MENLEEIVEIALDMRTRGSNAREHWSARHKRVASERAQVGLMLRWGGRAKPELPLRVVFTRVSVGVMDGDNLQAACKGSRDAVAEWLGIDDGPKETRVVWEYGQRKPEKGEPRHRLFINITPLAPAPPQLDTE